MHLRCCWRQVELRNITSNSMHGQQGDMFPAVRTTLTSCLCVICILLMCMQEFACCCHAIQDEQKWQQGQVIPRSDHIIHVQHRLQTLLSGAVTHLCIDNTLFLCRALVLFLMHFAWSLPCTQMCVKKSSGSKGCQGQNQASLCSHPVFVDIGIPAYEQCS